MGNMMHHVVCVEPDSPWLAVLWRGWKSHLQIKTIAWKGTTTCGTDLPFGYWLPHYLRKHIKHLEIEEALISFPQLSLLVIHAAICLAWQAIGKSCYRNLQGLLGDNKPEHQAPTKNAELGICDYCSQTQSCGSISSPTLLLLLGSSWEFWF